MTNEEKIRAEFKKMRFNDALLASPGLIFGNIETLVYEAFSEGYKAALATRPDVNQELVEALNKALRSNDTGEKYSDYDGLYFEVEQALAKYKAGESAGFTGEIL